MAISVRQEVSGGHLFTYLMSSYESTEQVVVVVQVARDEREREEASTSREA